MGHQWWRFVRPPEESFSSFTKIWNSPNPFEHSLQKAPSSNGPFTWWLGNLSRIPDTHFVGLLGYVGTLLGGCHSTFTSLWYRWRLSTGLWCSSLGDHVILVPWCASILLHRSLHQWYPSHTPARRGQSVFASWSAICKIMPMRQDFFFFVLKKTPFYCVWKKFEILCKNSGNPGFALTSWCWLQKSCSLWTFCRNRMMPSQTQQPPDCCVQCEPDVWYGWSASHESWDFERPWLWWRNAAATNPWGWHSKVAWLHLKNLRIFLEDSYLLGGEKGEKKKHHHHTTSQRFCERNSCQAGFLPLCCPLQCCCCASWSPFTFWHRCGL